MDAPPSTKLSAGCLLYPELLSRDELIEILLSRCVQSSLLEGLEKTKLVDLFQRIVLPLPQRVYKNNRRGKMLNSRIQDSERRIKNGDSDIHSENRTSTLIRISSKTSPSLRDRDADKSRDSLDHIIINDRRKNPKPEESKEVAEKRPKISIVENKPKTIIKLKRNMTSSPQVSPSSSSKDGDEEDKKKRRRIVWP